MNPITHDNFYTPQTLARITRGRWLVSPHTDLPPIRGIAIDSRTLNPDQIFLAIPGQHADGHDFIEHAASRGAPLAIISHLPRSITNASSVAVDAPLPLLMVDDPLDALQRLAHIWRDILAQATTRVIAVVGSNGKTTTRHLIHHTLHNASIVNPQLTPDDEPDTEPPDAEQPPRPLQGTQSHGNFNNHLGLPLTLLAAQPEHDFVVAEIGTDRPGETDALARIARPDIAVLTSLGHEHLAQFKTLDAIAAEHATLFDHLQHPSLALIHDQARPRVQDEIDLPPDAERLCFGTTDDADVQTRDIQSTPTGLSFEINLTDLTDEPCRIDLPLLAHHNALNATAAFAVAHWLGIAHDQIAQHLATAPPFPGRLEPITIQRPDHPIHLINDTYNANPESTIAALNTLLSLPAPDNARRIAILGDMLDLGDIAADAHAQLGNWLARRTHLIDQLFLVGPLMQHAAHALTQADFPADRLHHLPQPADDIAPDIIPHIQPNDIILLKASRGIQLDRLIQPLRNHFHAPH